jgi:hypothetical protein
MIAVKRKIYTQQKDEQGNIMFDENGNVILIFVKEEEVEEEEGTGGTIQ